MIDIDAHIMKCHYFGGKKILLIDVLSMVNLFTLVIAVWSFTIEKSARQVNVNALNTWD